MEIVHLAAILGGASVAAGAMLKSSESLSSLIEQLDFPLIERTATLARQDVFDATLWATISLIGVIRQARLLLSITIAIANLHPGRFDGLSKEQKRQFRDLLRMAALSVMSKVAAKAFVERFQQMFVVAEQAIVSVDLTQRAWPSQ